MFTFPDSMIIYINGALIIWFLIVVARGYTRGLLLMIVDVVGTFVALFAAWVFAPVFVRIYQFVKPVGSGLVTIDQMVTQQINRMIWFLLLFIIAKLLLLLVTPLASVISKIPLVKQVNSAVGGIFSVVYFSFQVLLLIYFLSFPVVKNGQDIINKTWLSKVVELSEPVLEVVNKTLTQNEAIQSLVNHQSLTDQQQEELALWLQKKGFNEIEIKEFLNNYGR
ncbi:CvpA family protein [Erysipelothrix urinaevulpis]|uniref:CvpA family protein n=1 Tax=Erysipelothrix urinaevulpis TaxID=2683717 RepID=UPI00135A2427|nr:CvpA family protein [Erysipelothrix urinaevulpis]